jgi:predicted ester cyclase
MADLKDLNQRFNKEVFENGNLAAIDDLVAENVVEHQAPPPGFDVKPGREGVKQLIKLYLDAFSDWSVETHDLIQEGDKVVAHLTYTATHTGDFMGIPATKNRVPVEAIDITRYEGDKVAEHWGLIDSVAMLTGLGVMPKM